MSQICRKLESQFRTILCKYPLTNAPFLKFLNNVAPNICCQANGVGHRWGRTNFAGCAFSTHRAVLKRANVRGQTPICGFLRVPVIFVASCEYLRFSAKICVFGVLFFQAKAQMCKNPRISAKICVWARFAPLGLSP